MPVGRVKSSKRKAASRKTIKKASKKIAKKLKAASAKKSKTQKAAARKAAKKPVKKAAKKLVRTPAKKAASKKAAPRKAATKAAPRKAAAKKAPAKIRITSAGPLAGSLASPGFGLLPGRASYARPPGSKGPTSQRKLKCPLCDYVWWGTIAGETVPLCPIHHIPLV